MRTVLRGLIVLLLVLWGWLAFGGKALLVWQGQGTLELRCSYITALDLIEARYLREEGSPLGRKRCPIVIDAPGDLQ